MPSSLSLHPTPSNPKPQPELQPQNSDLQDWLLSDPNDAPQQFLMVSYYPQALNDENNVRTMDIVQIYLVSQILEVKLPRVSKIPWICSYASHGTLSIHLTQRFSCGQRTPRSMITAGKVGPWSLRYPPGIIRLGRDGILGHLNPKSLQKPNEVFRSGL